MTEKNNKPVNKAIILDLNNVDFEHNIKGGNIWQQDAVYEFNKRLEKTALQAKNQLENRTDNSPTIIHDAIFIGGARGTGKTVFLRNIEGFWQDYSHNDQSKPKIHFCNSVDPTLLVDHDNFANVVIAHLYNEVEDKLHLTSGENLNQDAFYKALRTVSKSLGKQEHLDDGLSGLDRIIKYRSGIQLVKHFDSYINECKNVLKVDVIVFPIDDIDMALGRSYDVLDVVRRLLGCPKIIPVITGDIELYEPIIENRFIKDGDNKENSIIGEDQAKKLTQEYLKKVIPHHNRISLEPIERLLPTMEIYDLSGNTKSEPLSHSDYVTKLTGCFFGPLNGEEKSCDWPKPETAREVTQLIRDLAPSELDKVNRAELWQRYKVWACLKQDSTAYSNAVTAQKIEDLRNDSFVTLHKLHAFNPMIQLGDLTPKWQGRLFFKEQIEIDLTKNTAISKLNDQVNKCLETYSDKEIYRSMPAIEKLDTNLVIVGSAVNNEFINSTDEELIKEAKRILLDTFTFNNYYELTLKTKRQVFFSRAYELLASSLLNFNFNCNTKDLDGRKIFWSKVVRDIYKRAPFYSIPAIFPTKAFNVDLTEREKIDDQEESLDANFDKTVNHLAEGIALWEIDFKDRLNAFENDSLMPIIFSVFNKVFTQLRTLRNTIDKNKYGEETLSDLALRFKYITINAFATFMKPAPVVLQNVGVTEKYNTLRKFDSYRKVAPPIRDNVGYFFNFSKIENNDPFALVKNDLIDRWESKAYLLQAIATHPILVLLDKKEMSGNYFNVFRNKNDADTDIELAKTAISSLNIGQVTKSDLDILKKEIQTRKFNVEDHQLIFGVTEEDISAWSSENKSRNKQHVVVRAKIICKLLGISFSTRLAQVNFYKNYLKDL